MCSPRPSSASRAPWATAASPRCSRCSARGSLPAWRRATRSASPACAATGASKTPRARAPCWRASPRRAWSPSRACRTACGRRTWPVPSSLLGGAQTIYVLGLGGSFPVAAHLTYVLRKLGRRVVILDGLGSALGDQAAAATPKDALIAISFKTYNPDTVAHVSCAARTGAAGGLHHRQPAQPHCRGRRRRVRDPRSCRKPPCARWWDPCAWCRASP